MIPLAFTFGNSQMLKLSAVSSQPIISCKHRRGHGFAEASWAADADESLFRIDDRIRVCDQIAFVDIDLGIERYLKILVAWI